MCIFRVKFTPFNWNLFKLDEISFLKKAEKRWFKGDFETYSNINVSNQVLRKLVKHHNLVNVNSRELLYLQRAPSEVFFFYTFLLNWCNWHSCCDFSRLQMWLQSDKVSCLKTLINTILSTFTSTSWFTLWGVFDDF